MTNRLEKTKTLLLLSPGSPGIAAVPGTPYRESYSYWTSENVTTSQWVVGANGKIPPMTFVPANSGAEAGTAQSQGYWTYQTPVGLDGVANSGVLIANANTINARLVTQSTTSATLITVPARDSVEAIPAVPPTPAQWVANYNLGWNSGAISIEAFTGDFTLTFNVPTSSGVAVGLSPIDGDTGQSWEEIGHAWLVTGTSARIAEHGALVSEAQPVYAGTTYGISRIGSGVYYSLDGVFKYRSLLPENGRSLIVDSSLYAGGDAIVDAAVSAYSAIGVPNNGRIAGSTRPTVGMLAELGVVVNRIAGSTAPTHGTLTVGPASFSWGIAGSTAPTIGSVDSSGGYNSRINGSTKPTYGRLSQVAPFTPSFSAVLGGTAPTEGSVLSLSGKAWSIAGSTAPTFGAAGLSDKIMGRVPPTYGLAYSTSGKRPEITSFGPRWYSQISFGYPLPNIHDTGPKWESSINQGVSVHSIGPNWSSSISSAVTIISNIHERGPKFRYVYALLSENGPVWKSHISFARNNSYQCNAKAYWANLMVEDGPEVTVFTHGMAAFKQLARIGDTIYGLMEGGDIHPIGGEDDNGMAIQPSVSTVNSQYGSTWSKRCQFVYLGTANDLKVTPIVDGTAYSKRTTTRGSTGEKLARLPGGLIGVNWAFKIEALNGSHIRINNFTPRLDELSTGI